MIPLSPKHFLLSLSGLGVTSSGLLAGMLATRDKYQTLNLIFRTKAEAGQELIREGERECGEGSVGMTNKAVSITSEFYKQRNSKDKNWNEYQSCLKSVGEKEKYKLLFSTKNSRR